MPRISWWVWQLVTFLQVYVSATGIRDNGKRTWRYSTLVSNCKYTCYSMCAFDWNPCDQLAGYSLDNWTLWNSRSGLFWQVYFLAYDIIDNKRAILVTRGTTSRGKNWNPKGRHNHRSDSAGICATSSAAARLPNRDWFGATTAASCSIRWTSATSVGRSLSACSRCSSSFTCTTNGRSKSTAATTGAASAYDAGRFYQLWIKLINSRFDTSFCTFRNW